MRTLTPWVLLLASTILLLLVSVFGFRTDAAELGPAWLWLPSLIEMAMGMALLAVGLEEATPGHSQHQSKVAICVGAGFATHCAASVLTQRKTTGPTAHAMADNALFLCMGMELLIALPFLVAAGVILQRGLAARPARSGICLGLGAGLGADALWRLLCPYADLRHVLSSHLTGIACVLLAGMLAGFAWDRLRLRRLRHRGHPAPGPSAPP